MSQKLSSRTIESLQPRAQRYQVWDALLPGFGLRVSPNGRKTWFAMARAGGRLTRHTIGTFPTISLTDAREAGRVVLASMQLGTYNQSKTERAPTFKATAADFIERYAKPKNRRWKDAERDLRRFSTFDDREIESITRTEVIRELGDRLIKSHPDSG